MNANKEQKNQPTILFLSSCLPRKCGIATFTQDLAEAIDNSQFFKSKLVAINDNGKKYDYSDDVIFQIEENDVQEYKETARKINAMDNVRVVSIQHEFKLYGSDHGENILSFIEEIKKPVITTFHTVLPYPSEERKNIVQSIVEKSEYVVVMASKAIDILKKYYGIQESKIVMIPHGIHDMPFENNKIAKEKLGFTDKMILLSFGFVCRHKGTEYVIDALPYVIKKFPNILYLIVGETHPLTKKEVGESYRKFLEKKVRKLGVQNNVLFHNKYVSLDDLKTYLNATDLYICYTNSEEQITSGTLVYAMGAGRVVIASPFSYAKEIITPDIGIILGEFRNPKLISDAIVNILSNPSLKESMEKNAYNYTRQMTWHNVAKSYLKIIDKCLNKS